MFIPIRECFFAMSPEDFEKYSLEILREQTNGLKNLEIQHNVIMKKVDGDYQIDGVIRFDAIGVRYITLVECKHYNSPISREKVQILYDKIRAIGAHKGILISTSNFQSGAIKYASEHGIALIQIAEADTRYEIRELNVIMNASKGVFNNGKLYGGVMQQALETGGTTCKYLREDNDYLKEFLLEV